MQKLIANTFFIFIPGFFLFPEPFFPSPMEPERSSLFFGISESLLRLSLFCPVKATDISIRYFFHYHSIPVKCQINFTRILLPEYFHAEKKSFLIHSESSMRRMGLEPTRCCHHRHLKPARLPIPPSPRLCECCTRNSHSI